MAIFRAKAKFTKSEYGFRKGHTFYKMFDAKNLEDAKKKSKNLVGSGRKIVAILPTKLKGTTKSRRKLSRRTRFGSGYY